MTPPFTLPKQKKRFSSPPVIQVLNYNSLTIGKGVLCFIERNSVLFDVLCIFELIPFKVWFFHGANVIRSHTIVNRNIDALSEGIERMIKSEFLSKDQSEPLFDGAGG